MILALLIFIALVICCVFIYRTKYANIIALYFIGIEILVLSGAFYYIRLSNYVYGNGIDYYMYNLSLNWKFNIYDISIIHNIGIIVLMVASILSVNIIKELSKWKKVLLCIPILMFFIANLPETKWILFLKMNSQGDGVYSLLEGIVKNGSVLIFILYLLMPMMALLSYTIKTKMFLKRRYGITCIICTLTIYLILYFLFFDGALSQIMFYNLDLLNFPKTVLEEYKLDIKAIISFICMMLICVTILLYMPFEKHTVNSWRRFNKRSQIINENMYMVMHTYKNVFLGIRKLVKMGIEAANDNNSNEVIELFGRIEHEAETSFENISRMLTVLHDVSLNYYVFSVENCIDEALKKSAIDGLKIISLYGKNNTIVFGNKIQVMESFVNIINNSAEAIKQKAISDGEICIEVYAESDMLCVKITDNGCGIPPKNRRDVFKPFYTTKSKRIGNGLGLDFVKNVVTIHGGDVRVKSTEGVFTTVEICLPVYKGNKNTDKKIMSLS